MDSESKHGSALAFENSSKCHEADLQSSSLKSEISTETHLSPGNGSFEMDMATRRNNLIATEDGLNTLHDSQHTTESSCSSSLHFASSSSKTFDRSPEELVTASSESGVSVQIASKAIRNANERNGVKFSSMISKGGIEISHNLDHEVGTKGKSVEMVSKHEDEFCVIESADSSTTKHGKKDAKDQDKIIAGFDLNEDINANEPDDHVQRNFASVSSHGAIYVVAKAGIPTGRPSKLLKFEGELCWKGTAETSAFRRTSHSKNSDGKTCCTDYRPKIDLNVDAVEDNPANGIPPEHERASSPSTLQHSHSENHRKSKIPLIDLNCSYEAADERTQVFLTPKPESSPLLDLNLDSSASLACRSQLLGNKTSHSDCSNGDSCFARNVYLADSSSMQHLVMALPPNSSFRFGSRDPLLSTINQSSTMPYTRYYQEHGFFCQPSNPSSVQSSFSTPRFTRFLHDPSRNNVSAFVPKPEVKTENLVSISGSKIHGPRLFPFLSEECPMREPTHQEAWYAPSLKRKELEGRQDGYHLDYKQVN